MSLCVYWLVLFLGTDVCQSMFKTKSAQFKVMEVPHALAECTYRQTVLVTLYVISVLYGIILTRIYQFFNSHTGGGGGEGGGL